MRLLPQMANWVRQRLPWLIHLQPQSDRKSVKKPALIPPKTDRRKKEIPKHSTNAKPVANHPSLAKTIRLVTPEIKQHPGRSAPQANENTLLPLESTMDLEILPYQDLKCSGTAVDGVIHLVDDVRSTNGPVVEVSAIQTLKSLLAAGDRVKLDEDFTI